MPCLESSHFEQTTQVFPTPIAVSVKFSVPFCGCWLQKRCAFTTSTTPTKEYCGKIFSRTLLHRTQEVLNKQFIYHTELVTERPRSSNMITAYYVTPGMFRCPCVTQSYYFVGACEVNSNKQKSNLFLEECAKFFLGGLISLKHMLPPTKCLPFP